MAPAPLLPAYLVWGEDRAKIDEAVRRLIARMTREGALAPERFPAADTPAAEVVAACEALAFGGRRLVIVGEVDAWKAADADALVAYLESPNPETTLALVAAKSPAQRLLQAVRRLGGELHYGMGPKAKRGEQRQWFVAHLAREVHARGGEISERVAALVVDRLGGVTDDTRPWLALALSGEAAKLVAYAGGEAIDRAAVEAVVVAHPDAPAYELADAIARGDRAGAFRTLANAADQHDSRASPAMLQWAVARHFRAVAGVQELGPGAGAGDVARVGGPAGYPAQRVLAQAGQLPPGRGAGIFARLAQLEIDLRVSSLARLGRSPDDGRRMVWERAVREIVDDVRPARAPDS